MSEYKTPGVYIKEKNAFGNSVVEAETAIPAFIGLTEIAQNGNDDLTNIPWKISSMTEFVKYFGGAPKLNFTVDIKKYHYAPTSVEEEGVMNPMLIKPNSSVFQFDEETEEVEILSEEKTEGDKKITVNKECKVGYSFCVDGKNSYTLYYNMLLFFANGGGTCYVVSVGGYNPGLPTVKNVTDALDALVKEREVTMIVVPEAVNSTECAKIQQQMMKHCGEMANRFAILDVPSEPTSIPLNKRMETFQNTVTGYYSYGASYFPWLNTSVMSDRDLEGKMFTWGGNILTYVGKFANVDKNFTNIISTFFTTSEIILDEPVNVEEDEGIIIKGHTFKYADVKAEEIYADSDTNKIGIITEVIDSEQTDKKRTVKITWYLNDEEKQTLHQALLSASPLYKEAVKSIVGKLNLLPPSAAMAGIYTMVDRTRGVWKAPANVTLNYVNSPAEDIDDDGQAGLNAPMTGKAINVIRTFRGEGVKVWGARTLDGNSLDWRYINVRRTLLFLEESVRNAARAYVFEPNEAGTWINMRCMIENFLRSVWKRGGLAGATPEDAFEVHVGLGDTMTGEDILEGIMRITVLVAITHPAEFIEITFQQQMQKS